MWRTVLVLLVTLVAVPFLMYWLDTAPRDLQVHLLTTTYAVCLVMAALCFVASSLTGNMSQVDKLWSIMPVIYAWMVYAMAPGPRILLMACLVTLWGCRLTYNFWRRGGYTWPIWLGEEDYRWAVLRAKPEFRPAWKWTLFNLIFISWYQMSLVWMITLPMIKSSGGGPLTAMDGVLAAFALGCIVMETIADQQQWNFQREKQRRKETGTLTGTRFEKGFVHDGLWALSRHPNYFAEQAFWVVLYGFSIIATSAWINWSIAGFLLLILLFQGSADFSEGISRSKYPHYQKYIAKVPRFIPLKW